MTMRERDEPMTDEGCVAAGGVVRPSCGGDAVEGGPIDVDGPRATQQVICVVCEKAWRSTYELTGYSPG
ncbi:hypothetical protein [Paludisphaera borealis]|uniref:Uncharacterized protein n=1 Tax=Paludisphaera borealis TaxID=1387353 RepID=A0A1U7CWB3_9BACT|nr:hypothetical protein [Paludisphaera borealis]APW63237.1 hypothetical protein BSF38_04801 [Paludisphaera borealis]MDR3619233.1 hypothetical protein [Paludisphaera borealis]